jgi:putative ABC transport system permease protein
MSWLSRLRNAAHSARLDRELREEMESHIENRAEALIAAGMSPEEAAREARKRMGNQLLYRESSREARLFPWLESLLQDVRFGSRMLRKSAGITMAAVLALGLAIGACTAAFSLIDALLLRPLPVNQPERLVALSYPNVVAGQPDGSSFSYSAFDRFRNASASVADLFAINFGQGVQAASFGGGEEERTRISPISGEAFDALGIPPALGRTVNAEDSKRRNPVTVLGYSFWQSRFGASPDVLGRWMTWDGRRFQIVGVARKGFYGLDPGFLTDLWLPIEDLARDAKDLANPEVYFLSVWGKLRPGTMPERLQKMLQPAFAATRLELRRSFEREGIPPGEIPRILNAQLKVESSANGHLNIVRFQFRQPLWILGIVAGLVLLIACSNLANLFVARAEAREKEMAMRAAVGAGHRRLMQQMIVECGLIAAAACVIALVFAQAAAPALVNRLMPSTIPAYLDLQLNARVFLFVALAGLAATLLFGAIPALRTASVSPDAALKSGARSSVRTRALRPLIAAQVGFSFVVLFVSGLLLVSFRNLMNVDLGFTKQGVILLGLDGRRLDDDAANRTAILTTLDRIRQQPGVLAASMSNIELVAGPFAPMMRPFVRIPGQAQAGQGPLYLRVAPGFFNTMQIRMLSGRDFTAADLAPDVSSVIVNQVFARKYFPNGDPLGRRFERGDDSGWAPQQIVGVVADAKYNSLRETPSPTVYEPLRWVGAARLAVRTAENPAAIGPLLRQAVSEANPAVRVSLMELESKKIENGILPERLLALLAGFFVLVAAALAAVGLYGVLSYLVVRQTKEIGIRMALGAQRGAVARMVLTDMALMLALGAALGLAAGLALARYVESMLFEVKPSDWTSAALPLAALAAIAAMAALGPLTRALRVDPGAALRCE